MKKKKDKYNTEDFISLLKKNDKKSIREFIIKNGKKPKPISPFYIRWEKEKGGINNGNYSE